MGNFDITLGPHANKDLIAASLGDALAIDFSVAKAIVVDNRITPEELACASRWLRQLHPHITAEDVMDAVDKQTGGRGIVDDDNQIEFAQVLDREIQFFFHFLDGRLAVKENYACDSVPEVNEVCHTYSGMTPSECARRYGGLREWRGEYWVSVSLSDDTILRRMVLEGELLKDHPNIGGFHRRPDGSMTFRFGGWFDAVAFAVRPRIVLATEDTFVVKWDLAPYDPKTCAQQFVSMDFEWRIEKRMTMAGLTQYALSFRVSGLLDAWAGDDAKAPPAFLWWGGSCRPHRMDYHQCDGPEGDGGFAFYVENDIRQSFFRPLLKKMLREREKRWGTLVDRAEAIDLKVPPIAAGVICDELRKSMDAIAAATPVVAQKKTNVPPSPRIDPCADLLSSWPSARACLASKARNTHCVQRVNVLQTEDTHDGPLSHPTVHDSYLQVIRGAAHADGACRKAPVLTRYLK